MDRRVHRYSKNHDVQTRRARLRPETGFLAVFIQEVNGLDIRRLCSCECGARQRPHTQQVFVNALPKGRLLGRICIQAQGRFTHCSRPPSPQPLIKTKAVPTHSGSRFTFKRLLFWMTNFARLPTSGESLEKSESHFDRNLSRDAFPAWSDCWPELPLPHSLNRFFVKPQTRALGHLNIGRTPVQRDYN